MQAPDLLRSRHAGTRIHPLRGRGVLVLGDHRQSLAVARSLQRAGYRVIAGRAGDHPTILERSRCITEVWKHPPPSDPRAWAEALEVWCLRRDDVGVVFPVGDGEIDLAGPLAPRLPLLLAVVSPAVTAICRTKSALLSLAADAGIPVEPWEIVAAPHALESAVRRVGLPAVLKPDTSPMNGAFPFKAAIISCLTDARQLAAECAFPAGGFVLQHRAPGVRYNVYFVACEGRILGEAHMRIVRTDRPDGTGLAVEGVSVAPRANLTAWTAALAARLSYTGVGCAQFQVDASQGIASLLEINARLGANAAAPCACGLDLPRLFIEALLGAAEAPPPPRVGRRYAWLSGDLGGLASSIRTGRVGWAGALRWLGLVALAQLRARDHITWSWRDPLPTLTGLGGLVTGWALFLRRWLERRRRALSAR